jgi:hypothetical protein
MGSPSKLVRKVDDRHIRLKYMGGRCVICRRSIAAVERRFLTSKGVHEYNHVDPAQKSPIYEKLIRRVVSAAQLDELDKCNLLCRVCHGIWHSQRLRGKAILTLTLPNGRVVKKLIRHHGLIEIKRPQPKVHLFADEPCQLEVYMYRLGGGRRVYRVGFELEKGLARLLLATRRRRTLRIWDRKGLAFVAERLDAMWLQLQFSTRFSVLKFEGMPDTPDSPHIWVRNGKAIIEGRGVRKTGGVRFEMEYAALERSLAAKVAKREMKR